MGHRWLQEEFLIVLDLYLRHRPKIPGERSAAVQETCDLVNRLRAKRGAEGSRTASSIVMGLQNILNVDPDDARQGLINRGEATEEIWTLYAHRPAELAAKVARIRDEVKARTPPPAPEAKDEDHVAEEGRRRVLLHYERDRDKKAVRLKKEEALQALGALRCEACGFDFSKTYGALGEGFIECHHVIPLARAPPSGVPAHPDDLALVCANCHRMIHRAKPWLSVEDLKALLERERLAKKA